MSQNILRVCTGDWEPESDLLQWNEECTVGLDSSRLGLHFPRAEYGELLRSFRREKWVDALSDGELSSAVYNLTAGQVCPMYPFTRARCATLLECKHPPHRSCRCPALIGVDPSLAWSRLDLSLASWIIRMSSCCQGSPSLRICLTKCSEGWRVPASCLVQNQHCACRGCAP